MLDLHGLLADIPEVKGHAPLKGGAVWDVLDPVEYERTRAETGHGTRLTT